MANGEPFDMNKHTAAHKTLPLGTCVVVTNPRTEQSVLVKITDRGPYVAGRDFDLSMAAAAEIGLIRHGVMGIQYKVVGRVKPKAQPCEIAAE